MTATRRASGPRRMLLATGGTGGHIYPALAVADAATRAGYEVTFLGQRGGMEERLTAEAGYPFFGVDAGKWDRSRPDPRQALKAFRGLSGAVKHVERLGPSVIVGFGGFASFPGCYAAVRARVPLVLHEGNAYPSRVNRWFAKRAKLVIAAQSGALQYLPNPRMAVIPFPVRELRSDRAAARSALGLPPEAPVTLVMGGSQGSLFLNDEVPAAFESLAEGDRPVVLHATGPRWEQRVLERTRGLPGYHVRPYVDATDAWAAADLAITRAGMGTISEAAFHGVPLLLVPLPSAAEDHQLHNARAVAAAGAGALVEERDIGELGAVWLAALRPERLRQASRAASARTPAGAAERIVAAVEEATL